MEEGNKINDASYEDPEKVIELFPKATIDNGEVKQTRLLHANPDDGDLALKAFLGHEGELITMTPEQEKALLRKIDWHIMPVCPSLENHVTNVLTLNADVMRCLWTQLPRQNYTFVCQRYGPPDRNPLEGDKLPVAWQHVLYRVPRMGIPNQPSSATLTTG